MFMKPSKHDNIPEEKKERNIISDSISIDNDFRHKTKQKRGTEYRTEVM